MYIYGYIYYVYPKKKQGSWEILVEGVVMPYINVAMIGICKLRKKNLGGYNMDTHHF